MSRAACPKCGRLLVEPSGPYSSRILLLGEFPGFHEVQEGRPWIGPAGEVLKAELRRAGMNFQACRTTNMWLHEPVKECDINWHLEQVFEELKNKDAVLLIGSDVCKWLVDKPVSEVSGLIVQSALLPKTVSVAVASYNPAVATKQEGVGEVRLALERFATWSRPYRD